MSNWFMKCPKCGASVNKSKGDTYKEDLKTLKGWQTFKRRKIYYDCSSKKCDWTRTETENI